MRATLLMNKAIALTKVPTHFIQHEVLHTTFDFMKQLGLFSQGLRTINQSLKLNPSYFKAFRARGRIYVELELYESAIEDFTTALGCHLSNADASDVQALILEIRNMELKAEREAVKGRDYYKILGEQNWVM